MSVLEIQQALKAAGFDPGPLDGKMGPKTKSAIRAFQQARGLTVDGIVGPQTTAALRGNAAAGAPAGGTSMDEQIRQQFPEFAWLLNEPELRNILTTAVANKWPTEQTTQALHATNWWRSKTDAEVSWLQELATNPAEATRRLNNYDSITKYIGLAASYGQTVSFEQAARMVDRVVRGEVAPDALEEELRINAKTLYPYLAQSIDAGGNVASAFEPVKNAAAQWLGVNPDEVKLSDARWRSLMTVDDGKGGVRRASDQEIAKAIRTDPQYGFRGTQNGRDAAFGMLDAISSGFGLGGLQ